MIYTYVYIYISILCFWESIKYRQTKYCDAHVYWYFLTPLLRWHIFESWCMTHHADQVHCHVVSVLEFLQEKLSPVHVLVLSGLCGRHFSLPHSDDRVSVGEHPLVARSICEAKQMRLPTIATVHLWDLAVKLLCTRSGWDPFWTTRVSACQVSDSKDGVSHGYYYIAILWRELRICRLCQSHHPT